MSSMFSIFLRRANTIVNSAYRAKSTGSRIICSSNIVRSRRLLSSRSEKNYIDIDQPSRVSILTEIVDTPGSLYEILKYFWKFDVSITKIESRPSPKDSSVFIIQIDFNGSIGDQTTDKLMSSLRQHCKNTLVLDEKEVPWYPRHISELDLIANRILSAGADLDSDHPGFSDPVYRKRRQELAEFALNYSWDEKIPYIKYTDDEIKTWGIIYEKLNQSHAKYACKEYKTIMPLMEKYCKYGPTRIPQAQDISDFLMRKTGFRLRPVAGLLSSRDFLNGLAYRVFFSTQYIRHHSKPLYTPEPDICHELLGHVPMFADPDFAEFSQEIGLASLGASDAEVSRLATCYWFSVEFGLLKEGNSLKAYGAGLLSSFGELEYSCKEYKSSDENKPIYYPWDPNDASITTYPITTYQPKYFVAENLADAKLKMRHFCENLPKPFHARYNPLTSSIWVDRCVKRLK